MKDLKDVIFVHIPRTAGTSIGTALGTYKKQHRHFFARKYIAIRPDWNTCFKFSFVRNPWERTVSLFMHQTKGEGLFKDWLMAIVKRDGDPLQRKKPWKLSKKMASTGGHSFPWKCQTDWLVDNNGKLCMDFIGRYENLKGDFEILCELLGPKYVLPHLNETKHVDYQSYYDSETRDIVANWHRRDIELFGYKFGNRITFL